jgi:glycosyltransferase involved in cell wall biosynthesis
MTNLSQNRHLSLKVLNVYRTYFPDPPGGLQEAIRQICATTSNFGVENTIFTLSPKCQPNVIERPEAHVVRERSWLAPASCDIGGLAAFITYSKLMKQADVVHYFHPWPFADVLNFLKEQNKPAVLTYISDVVRQRFLGALYSPLMWSTLHKMDVIVANCPAYAQTSPILSHPSIREKVRVIPLGIDENTYPQIGDNSVFKRLGIAEAEPYFLFLGVLRYYKGIHTLISAAKNTNAKIIIAGSGPEAGTLKLQVKELGLKNIIFAGQVTDTEKVALIKSCLALVLPSHLRSEAYGMVLVEASMMKKPMISCEIGTGTSFVNLHEVTGFVVPPETPQRLATAMQELLADEALANKMGLAARSRYEQLFSGPALGQAYASLYSELL